MMASESKGGFLAVHWDWLVALIAALALVGGIVAYFVSAQGDPDEEAEAAVSRLEAAARRSDTGVVDADMAPYDGAVKAIKSPTKLAEVPVNQGSFLVSRRRVHCPLCEAPIPAGLEKCPACRKDLPKEQASLDKDKDGMPNDWELKYGLNVDVDDREEDKDNDGFSNWEEFVAKTDPSDPKSHPDYLDSLRIQLPLVETTLPFQFTSADPLPGGKYRYRFFDPARKNDHGKKGLTYSVLEDEEIGNTGFSAKAYEQKSERRKVKGGMEKMVDVSEVTLVRKGDGKALKLRVGEKRKSVDVQAKLVYDRRGIQEFTVVPGAKLELNGTAYKVRDIRHVVGGAEMTVENVVTGSEKIIKALE